MAPDHRTHRGPHPRDVQLFAPVELPKLRAAARDLVWLLDRGYPINASLKLAGDRYQLQQRQRLAVARCVCSTSAARGRAERVLEQSQLRGQTLWIDGYNLITTLEAALASGVLLLGCDGCYRDMASMHGSYRKVAETAPALELIARFTASAGVGQCHWLLDRPVSNSGRLKTLLKEIAAGGERPWTVELVDNPDPLLAASEHIVVTADSVILDGCRRWTNLAREIIVQEIPDAWLVDLSRTDAGPEM